MRFVLLILILTLPPCSLGQVFRHGRIELSFTSAKDYANPLKDVEVVVEFTAPDDSKDRALAFWDGGRNWKVRYSPEQTGEYEYRVNCSDEDDRGLDGKRGEFKVHKYKGRNPLYQHGPPQLSLNKRYFVLGEADASRLNRLRPGPEGTERWPHPDAIRGGGAPWFFLSDTAWNGALLSTRDEWNRYLADRAAKKFTAVQFVMTQWRAGRADELGQVAFTGADPIQINPAFFQRMDARFDAVNDHGLGAVPVLLWALTSKEKESPGESLSDDQAILLARYMVARYGAHHVIWFLGGDGDYRGAKAERWKKIGGAVFPPSRKRRLVTLHPRGMQSPWPDLKDAPWLDFFLYQSGHGNDARKWRWNATQGGAVDYKLEPPRPVIDGEPNYEAHLDYQTRQPVTDFQVRRAAYYSLLAAPPAGVSYGAHGIWYWGRRAEVPLDHPRTGVAQPWFECLDYPGARQMRVLREVFESLPWWKLRPDRSLLAEDPVDEEFRTYVMPARSESGDFALIYLPANTAVNLNLAQFKGRVTGTWIDPRTGARSEAGRWKPAPGIAAKTPGAGDWLLLLRVR